MLIIEDKTIAPYVIHVDGTQFTVGIPKVDKKGIESLVQTSYFTKLSSALQYIAKQVLVASNSQSTLTIEEFINLYEEINELLLERIKV